tara:strand:+ start:125 stop:544 length:420 start_codon:yes stop_codon:yes gene_type:complete
MANQAEILKDIYHICLGIKSNNDLYLHPNKAHTTIGAALFYGPKNEKVQCKGRSRKSLDSGEKVADHVYSRNQSGKYFMENDFNTFDSFLDWYWEKASIYVWVTKEENRKLIPFQSKGYSDDWRSIYREAGIELISIES